MTYYKILRGHRSNHFISPRVEAIESREIGPWTDEHPLNYASTAKAEFDRLFATPP